jgi:hypothetical protein
MAELDACAFSIGYDLKDWDNFYDGLNYAERNNAGMKTIRESYNRGVKKRVAEHTEILRKCVFIHGEANTGKTYAAQAALAGKKILRIGGGGTGKFDNLLASHDAIIIDDDTCPYLLNMADNYYCQAYRRRENNPIWAGDWFVVTSNKDFEEWIKSCGIKSHEHINALHTRFFECEIATDNSGHSYLALVSPSVRGSYEEQTKRLDDFLKFQKAFDETIFNYTHDDKNVDYEQYEDKDWYNPFCQKGSTVKYK